MEFNLDTVKSIINKSLKVIRMYDWLLDLYVLDFFVDNHWEKLPLSWCECCKNMDPQDFGHILMGMPTNHVLPLSLLSLIKTVKVLSLPREKCASFEMNTCKNTLDSCASQPKLKNLFLKHVKLKKRHEINLMANIVYNTACNSGCEAVMDFGSGLGHLVRVLGYKYDLYAAGIECQSQLTQEARKLDLELEYTAKKHLSESAVSKLRQPIHLNLTLTSSAQLDQLLLPTTMQNYGLIGLHPCGDLGPLLLRHFATSEKVNFICIVGCCYMKLTCDGESNGYPMSEYLKNLDNKLSYVSREISCHAIEVYCDRLRKGHYEDLKVHAYRAALERILLNHDPKLKHAPVRSIKHCEDMNFKRYCEMALERLAIPFPAAASTWAQGQADLDQWRRVVIVYTLRLTLAPLVETVILLDRVLYVLEHGFSCDIRPVFDPRISPRNHIIVARRS